MRLTPSRRTIAVLAVAVTLSGCDDSLAPSRVVILPITRLDAPASVDPAGTLVGQVTVESGGCRRFDRLQTTRASGRVTIRAIGRDASGPDVLCTGDIQYTVVEYRADGPFTDPFLVVGIQPDGEEMRRLVRVLTP